jgi:hypothetical protein
VHTTQVRPKDLPPQLDRAYDVEQIVSVPVADGNLAESKPFQKTFQAEPGYRIQEARFVEASKSADEPITLSILRGGAEVAINQELRNRNFKGSPKAWLFGSIITHQVLDR